jgi:hypothetical protein
MVVREDAPFQPAAVLGLVVQRQQDEHEPGARSGGTGTPRVPGRFPVVDSVHDDSPAQDEVLLSGRPHGFVRGHAGFPGRWEACAA